MSATSGQMAAPDDMVDLSAALGHRLRAQGWSVSSAESCTGGGIALAITSIAGSSDYFDGAIVAYSNEIKQRLLNVSPETLETVGAVSPECAREMAHGIRAALDTDVGISSTGIAGPGGATARKPVGLVYIAVATHSVTEVRELRLHGDRQTIMRNAVRAALELAETTIGADAPETETVTR